MAEVLEWGVIGTGGIASDFARALAGSKSCRLVSACGSSPEKSQVFAKQFELPRAALSLDELLSDASVQAVYVATPHPAHEQQALACIQAGKHVLCEKPITMDGAGAERVVAAARQHGVFLMEAYMYRCHPLLREMLARLEAGAIGEIQHLRADFSFRVPRDPKGRLFDLALGGGAILDVGGYPMSLARLIAGMVEGKRFAEPESLHAVGYVGPTGADEVTTATLRFSSGFTAVTSCAVHQELGRRVSICGDRGRLEVEDPWITGGDRQGRHTGFSLFVEDKAAENVQISTDIATYAIEAELVAATLPALEAPFPAMTWADSIGNMRALDRWRAALAAK